MAHLYRKDAIHVHYINPVYHRTGTLWEGRYQASAVLDNEYLLGCQRYIEPNTLRARMAADPADYRWSSHCGNTRDDCDPLITPHRA